MSNTPHNPDGPSGHTLETESAPQIDLILQAYTLDRVRAILAASRQHVSPVDATGGPPDAYLPGGEHVLRPVLDPNGELVRHLLVHRKGWKRRTLCPDELRRTEPSGHYPACAICQLAPAYDDGRMRVEEVTLMYGHLYTTEQLSPFWKPHQTYLVVMWTELAESIRAHLTLWLGTQPEPVCAMLNPYAPGPALRLRVTQRPQRSVSVALTAETFSPIALGDGYRPLTACWIGPEFNVADYQHTHAELQCLA